MTLSVVIVNYNVKYFLKQCLSSVLGSERRLADGNELELDVWVVDNDSVDGSVEMVRRDFPSVHLIENHENVGFAKANNQALSLIPHTSDLRSDNNPTAIDIRLYHPTQPFFILLRNLRQRQATNST